MKKLFLAVAAVAMIFATSCKKENVNGAEEPVVAGDNEFICVIDQNANPQNAPSISDGMGQMAHIDASNNVWWQVGDEIAYYGQQIDATGSPVGTVGYHTLTCSAQTGNRAYFSDENKHFDQGSHVAYYPATLVDVNNNNQLTLPNEFTIPSDKNAAFLPMYGTGSGQHYLTFHNICAVLKIEVPVAGNKIVIRTSDGLDEGKTTMPLSGEFTVGSASDNYKATINSSKGYQLTVNGTIQASDATNHYPIYVAIPEGTYYNFSFELYDENGVAVYQTPSKTITVAVSKVYPVGITIEDPVMSNCVFNVSSSKQVQFTRGNLYWNGSKWLMEGNQVACHNYGTNGIGLFYCSDRESDLYDESDPEQKQYTPSSLSFAQGNSISVEGTTGYYVLTSDEWQYILTNYTNKTIKSVDGTICLLIANDNTTDLSNCTTVNNIPDNVLCLPAAGWRSGDSFNDVNVYGYYMSSTPKASENGYGFDILYFESNDYYITNEESLTYAYAIRLVKTYTSPTPQIRRK